MWLVSRSLPTEPRTDYLCLSIVGEMTPKRVRDGLSTPAKRRKAKEGYITIWSTPDDWEQMVADATLSTSSVSTRRPKPRGLHSLVKCCSDVASRFFKPLWEVDQGSTWKAMWNAVPDHLRRDIRDGIFRIWGGVLTESMVKEMFVILPDLILPGDRLPFLSKIKLLKPLHPSDADGITNLILTHGRSLTDMAIAGLVYKLTQLESINLKGCRVGRQTVDAIITRCPNTKRINLKGTGVMEIHIQKLLAKFGEQLTGFKIDDVKITTEATFGSAACFPRITHLCLPGESVSRFSRTISTPTRIKGATDHNPLNWSLFFTTFPALTHLDLPDMTITSHDLDDPRLSTGGLVKLSVLSAQPLLIRHLAQIVGDHCATLKTIYMSSVVPEHRSGPVSFEKYEEQGFEVLSLGNTLRKCEQLERFKLDVQEKCGPQHVMSTLCSSILELPLLTSWRRSLKVNLLLLLRKAEAHYRVSQYLHLNIPDSISSGWFAPYHWNQEAGNSAESVADFTPPLPSPPLEYLELPSAHIECLRLLFEGQHGVEWLTTYTNLRSLDLSGTTVTGTTTLKELTQADKVQTTRSLPSSTLAQKSLGST
ncbi:hypothetical protein P7C73_g4959, partial [Tremellales sp. Uapishka_1]